VKKLFAIILLAASAVQAQDITGAGATFILVPEKSEKLEQIKLSVKFFDWAYTNGDKAADDLDYVALPLAVKNKIRADWRRLGLN